MDHIFVWTFKDVVGFALLGLIVVVASLVFAYDAWRNWRDKRKKNKRA